MGNNRQFAFVRGDGRKVGRKLVSRTVEKDPMTFEKWWESTQGTAPYQNIHKEAAREIWNAALAAAPAAPMSAQNGNASGGSHE